MVFNDTDNAIMSILQCKGVDFRQQFEEEWRNEESHENQMDEAPSRRFQNGIHHGSPILGAPSMPSHLPEAEAILPGHTLIRPALGMLKSAVKFPHKDLDNGAGVYGNMDKWGIRYDGRNERVLYSGFRRTGTPVEYLVIAPLKTKSPNSKFILSSAVLDLTRSTTDAFHFTNSQQSYVINGTFAGLVIMDKDNDVGRKLLHALHLATKNKYPQTTRIIQEYPKTFRKTNKEPNKNKINNKPRALRYVDADAENHGADESSEMESAGYSDVNTDTSEEESPAESKKKWFWDTKNAYNNIKINQDAPDHSELMPANVSEDLRSWWFYNQEDYQPFKNNLEE